MSDYELRNTMQSDVTGPSQGRSTFKESRYVPYPARKYLSFDFIS